MKFGVLGEVRAWKPDGTDRTVDIGHARQSSVLAALLFDANKAVSTEQLLDRVWGDRPPQTARGTLFTYLTRLRQALAPVPIERSSTGYRITVAPGALDLDRFTNLLARARATQDDRLAARTYELAFELWRGEPLPGLDTPWANDMRALLHHQRYAADLDHTDVLLRLGEHADLTADLTTRAAKHPLDERLAGQLLLALYRNGRQAEAVTYYQEFRERLAAELGTDPGQPLRELHRRILVADDIVLAPGPDRRARPPRQLPAPPRSFTGRAAALAALSEQLDDAGTVVISAIGGGGGIGKTSLALHWAHTQTDRFPDGQLFANLRGFDPSGAPAEPSAVLRGFLTALGVTDLPRDLEAQTALYRSVVADRQMLVLLDNAADTAQVTPLLAGSPAVTTLVTSRRPLTGLILAHGARAVPLDVLTSQEAHDLLTNRLGAARVTAEPDAVAALVEHCGGLPLALGIVAARAIVSPNLSLTDLAAQLGSHATRLDGLDTGERDLNLRAVFALSYQALSPAAVRLAGLLGIAPGPDISFAAADVLACGQAEMLLAELTSAHLVSQFTPGRYRMHDLVRLDAVERATALPAEIRDTALRDLVGFYVRTGQAADRLLDPRRPEYPISQDIAPHPLRDEDEAMTWLTTEHACLLAAQRLAAERGWHAHVWEMSFVTDTYHSRQGLHADHLTVLRTAVTATEAAADLTVRARLHANLAQVAARSGSLDESVEHNEHAIDLARQNHDPVTEAHALNTLAQTWGGRGDNHRARDCAAQALKAYEAIGNPHWVSAALNQLGWVEALLGEYDEARGHCEQALAIQRTVGHITGEVQDSLGFINERSGRPAAAVEWYRQAIDVFEEAGDSYNVATTLIQLGRANETLGAVAEAEAAWQQALRLCESQGRGAEAERLRQSLGRLGTAP